MGAAVTITVVSYPLRMVVPLGHEVWHLALGQAPAWVAGFTLGVLGGKRGWHRPLDERLARGARRLGWVAMVLCVAFVAAVASASGLDVLFGGGAWQSLVLATLEGSRQVQCPPELKYVLVASLGVALSFTVGAVLVRVPRLAGIV